MELKHEALAGANRSDRWWHPGGTFAISIRGTWGSATAKLQVSPLADPSTSTDANWDDAAFVASSAGAPTALAQTTDFTVAGTLPPMWFAIKTTGGSGSDLDVYYGRSAERVEG